MGYRFAANSLGRGSRRFVDEFVVMRNRCSALGFACGSTLARNCVRDFAAFVFGFLRRGGFLAYGGGAPFDDGPRRGAPGGAGHMGDCGIGIQGNAPCAPPVHLFFGQKFFESLRKVLVFCGAFFIFQKLPRVYRVVPLARVVVGFVQQFFDADSGIRVKTRV